MKKISLIFKESSEKIIKENFKQTSTLFVVKYSGLSSPDLSNLRQSLRDANATMLVVKNTVARRALKNVGMDEAVIKTIEGPCGIVFPKSEPVETTKVLYKFAKDHEKLQLEGGFLDDRTLAKKDIETLAKLPSKEMLRAQVVCTLNSPLSRLAMVLNGNLRKLVVCLDQIRQKKSN